MRAPKPVCGGVVAAGVEGQLFDPSAAGCFDQLIEHATTDSLALVVYGNGEVGDVGMRPMRRSLVPAPAAEPDELAPPVRDCDRRVAHRRFVGQFAKQLFDLASRRWLDPAQGRAGRDKATKKCGELIYDSIRLLKAQRRDRDCFRHV